MAHWICWHRNYDTDEARWFALAKGHLSMEDANGSESAH